MRMSIARIALLWVGSLGLGGMASAGAPSVEEAVNAPVVRTESFAPLGGGLQQPTANMGPVVVMGVGAAAFGAGVALLTTGVWDKGNQCIGDESCERQSQERILIGGILMGVGVGGIATGVVLGVGGEKTATVGVTSRF